MISYKFSMIPGFSREQGSVVMKFTQIYGWTLWKKMCFSISPGLHQEPKIQSRGHLEMPGGMGKPRGGDDFYVENQWINLFFWWFSENDDSSTGNLQRFSDWGKHLCNSHEINKWISKGVLYGRYHQRYADLGVSGKRRNTSCCVILFRKAMINQRISADSDKPIKTFFRGKFHFEHGYNEIYHQNLRDLTSICFIGHLH